MRDRTFRIMTDGSDEKSEILHHQGDVPFEVWRAVRYRWQMKVNEEKFIKMELKSSSMCVHLEL